MKYDVFNQSKFDNMPQALRLKLNKEVEEFMTRKQVVWNIDKCRHEMEKLKIIKKTAYRRDVVCMCGKAYKNV